MHEGNFRTRYIEATATLLVAGDVDDLALGRLEEVLESAIASGVNPVTIDLSDVEYLPSMALSVFVRFWRRAGEAGRELVLRAGPGTVAQRVLHLTGMPYQLSTSADELSES